MQTVVVHRGARDGYQAALALAEAGLLDTLFTDLYWPGNSAAAQLVERWSGARAQSLLRARCQPRLAARQVETCPASGLTSLALDKLSHAPFRLRAQATRWADRTLGRRAGEAARRRQAAILSYSYYGHSAFSACGPTAPRLLFQLHPHPESMRRILRRELADHPECAASLEKEWELALPEEDFERLCEETRMAQHWLAASSFTAETLIEHGADPARVHVIPYGVDLERFQPGEERGRGEGPLRVLFVGTINQRKGIKYLLEAVKMLGTRQIELMIRGRAVDDLSLVRRLVPQADVRLSVSAAELQSAYRSADLFVFPSVAEGFGHVLLEALASGLPVVSTSSTAAPDLVTDGREGFVVAPRRPDLIADRLEWALLNRRRLADMREAARRRAEAFTWARFRQRMAAVVSTAVSAGHEHPALAGSHV